MQQNKQFKFIQFISHLNQGTIRYEVYFKGHIPSRFLPVKTTVIKIYGQMMIIFPHLLANTNFQTTQEICNIDWSLNRRESLAPLPK